ncbi:hypothetical protein Vi05172_g7136 [Venturia inaequalis]|nr:hypothetical protein Vi05172_g7136 [Venturia inaequalis]
MALSITLQLTAAITCDDCSAKGMAGSTVCTNGNNVGCGLCCKSAWECARARQLGWCK